MRDLPALPGIPVTLRRSARASRFSLRVSRLDGRVTLTLPVRARESDGIAFLHAQEDWLRRALASMPQTPQLTFGVTFPLEGQALVLTPGAGRLIRTEGAALVVPGDAARLGARLSAWLKARARDRLAAASDRHAAALGRPYTALSLRDTRSRWGSCTHDGRLMFSWRLAMAPPEVLDYVAAHEVAHLLHMDHSAAFWAATGRLMPDYARHRDWLRRHGHELLAWRFRS